MLTFLLGRSGSGKTEYILKEIEKCVIESEKAYLLVPEQQVYISECMLADLPPSSMLCFEVISFSRLCEIAFSRLGGISERPTGCGVREILMWQTLREMSPVLKKYKGIKTDAALTSMMLSLIDELHASALCAEDCQNTAQMCGENELIPIVTQDIINNMSDEDFRSRDYSWRRRETILRNLKILEK